MPLMHYCVLWPDEAVTVGCSPSLVMQDYLQPDRDYPIDEFITRVRDATVIANDRMKPRYGFMCWSANEQLARIEARARRYAQPGQAHVRVLELSIDAS